MAGGPGVGSGISASAHNHAATRATLTSAEVTGSTGMTRSVGGDMGVTAAVQSESDSSGRLPGLAECCLGGRSGSCRSGPQCPRPPQTPCEDKGAPQGWEGWEVQFGGRLLAHGGMAGHLLLPGRTRPTPPRCPPSAPRGTGHGARDGTGWGAGPWPGRSPGALLAGAPALHGRDAGRVGRVPARCLLARGRGPGSGLGCGARPGPPLLLLLVGASGRKARLAKGAGGPEAGLPAGPLPPPTRRPPGDPDPGHARSDRVLSCSALTSAPPLRDP